MSLDGGESIAAPVRKAKASGPSNHHWIGRRPTVAHNCRLIGRTDLNRALTALWPWLAGEYPGILKGAYDLFQGRVKASTVKSWRQGKRRAPQWALDLARAELDQRIESLQHARALLAKEKGAD